MRTTASGGPDFGPTEIPERQYLVLGDNRGVSYDGRMFGLVSRDVIRGRALGIYYRSQPMWQPL